MGENLFFSRYSKGFGDSISAECASHIVRKTELFPFFTVRGKAVNQPSALLLSVFHRLWSMLFQLFHGHFVKWSLEIGTKKPPQWGLVLGTRVFCPDSEAHHVGHRGEVGIQICVERSVVVVDGAVGILQTITGQNAHNGGSSRDLLLALQQTGH